MLDFRKFRDIFGSSARFSEVPLDFRKFREILGSSARFSEVLRDFRKVLYIIGSSARFSEALRDFQHPSRPTLGLIPTPVQWAPGLFPEGLNIRKSVMM